eukprot:gb/GEZJ01000316.1/.p3 GENE.gb/GEZJ01000316.1/~~gb/GEZJ01000316.1/.p3  ORF type:complete len:103 (+),score=8.49 gb/GEZJ01000316.1/:123-431(+)
MFHMVHFLDANPASMFPGTDKASSTTTTRTATVVAKSNNSLAAHPMHAFQSLLAHPKRVVSTSPANSQSYDTSSSQTMTCTDCSISTNRASWPTVTPSTNLA